ncbi:hypothetical protein PHLGIDRAFT_18915 [Phlebiopsis gigantea 11061_1 CR5-6]|uniref:Uncharacterized protein n=1 Tax=Phlebiopsis gigantea (strain 11061_1 CR5-6) TaxID=745531 RepID=A0A0C3NTA4_PHLG1|nr:hypothetical protein PHLGIDRAFT_18915 [Phlebiopsis gigantea 11061_1 CR5-6]
MTTTMTTRTSLRTLIHTHMACSRWGTRIRMETKVVAALKGAGDAGSRITLIGLASNVGLTVSKGLAGWYMNSASLLADAGHTAGDLIGDLITLFCWRLSRKPPSETYPRGYAKFEVLGTTAVSLLLTGGALGLGLHSLALLSDSLAHSAAAMAPGVVQDVLMNATHIAQNIPSVGAEHSHAHALDPNAAWFALVGVLAKEWLYRATRKVADAEGSPVLFANALHHRSDAYSSAVALVAILGTWWLPHLPLDQLGGLLVSVLIMQQGWGITMSSFKQLTDAGVSAKTKSSLLLALQPLLPSASRTLPQGAAAPRAEQLLLGVEDLRATRAGSLMFVDLTAKVPQSLSVSDTSALENRISRTLKEAKKEVSEVRVRFEPVETGERVA